MRLFDYALELGAARYFEAQPADDVYALGVTAYRLLSGVYPPRDADSDSASDRAKRREALRELNDACPELSALILRMLSEDPEARGSDRQVAEELERMLGLSRPELDQPWVTNSSRQPTEKVRRVVPLWYALREQAACLAPVGSFIVVGLLVSLLAPNVDRGEVASTEPTSQPQAAEKPDAGTGAMGEEAMASVAPAGTPPASEGRISREVPDEPLPGQKQPPCNHRAAVVINGGCWLRLPVDAEKPPCEPIDYEHGGRCYSPLFTRAERVPTSDEPRRKEP
jgi:serine/threonine protein kinase